MSFSLLASKSKPQFGFCDQIPNGETTKPNRNPKPKKKIGEDSEEDGEKGTRYEGGVKDKGHRRDRGESPIPFRSAN